MSEQDEAGAPRVVDKRRIDPESGEVREGVVLPPLDTEPPDAAGGGSLQSQLDERTDDLLRLKAEFDNYRKRVERDRVALAEQAGGRVVAELLPVLDDVEKARAHGDVDGVFKTVAERLEGALTRLGLERFADPGDPFDPAQHEAVAHFHSPDVTEPSCVEVMRSGYRFAGRLLRPAMVAVADPADESVVDEGAADEATSDETGVGTEAAGTTS